MLITNEDLIDVLLANHTDEDDVGVVTLKMTIVTLSILNWNS